MPNEQDHWTERGRAASVSNTDVTDRPRRSVLALDPMRRSWSFKTRLLAFAVVLIAGLLVALFSLSGGPSWRGRDLRSWLVLLQSPNESERQEAEAAVRGIGTNAMPVLIDWISHRDSAAEKRVTAWLNRIGLFTRDRFSENYYHSKALCGFRALGTNGQCAVPALRQLLTDPAHAGDAAYALVWVAPSEAERLAEIWMADTNRFAKIRGLKLKAELADR